VAQRWNNTVNITQLTHRKHHWCLSWTNINEKSIKIFHSKNTFTVNRKTRHCKLHTGSLYTWSRISLLVAKWQWERIATDEKQLHYRYTERECERNARRCIISLLYA